MTWAKLGTLCSLKAIVAACFLTPTASLAPVTPAYAQFQIVIPGLGWHGNGYRRGYRYRGYRHRGRRGGRGGGGGGGEVSGNTGKTGVGGGGGSSYRSSKD